MTQKYLALAALTLAASSMLATSAQTAQSADQKSNYSSKSGDKPKRGDQVTVDGTKNCTVTAVTKTSKAPGILHVETHCEDGQNIEFIGIERLQLKKRPGFFRRALAGLN